MSWWTSCAFFDLSMALVALANDSSNTRIRTVASASPAVKGTVSRDEYFLEAYNNNKLLSVHALIVFIIFLFFVDEKMKNQSFSLLL
jgi:hypothetical protein